MKKTLLFLSALFLITSPADAASKWLAATAQGIGDGATRATAMAYSGANYTALEATLTGPGDEIVVTDHAPIKSSDTLIVTKSGDEGPAVAFTADATTDVFTSVGHNLSNGDVVKLYTTGTLPTVNPFTTDGLPTITPSINPSLALLRSYIVTERTADTFKLRVLDGWTPLNLLTNGTGTHTFKKVNPFKIRCEGSSRINAKVIQGNREVPEANGASNGNVDTGNTMIRLSAGVSNVMIENFNVERVQYFLEAYNSENHNIYLKDVLVKHYRELLRVSGSASCAGYAQTDCPTASYGWIIDNVDGDYSSKGQVRMSHGFQHFTVGYSDVDSRYLYGDFPQGFHAGQTKGSRFILNYSGAAGTLVPGETVTSDGVDTLTVEGVYVDPIVPSQGNIVFLTNTGSIFPGEALSNGTGWTATAAGIDYSTTPASPTPIVATFASQSTATHHGMFLNVTGRRAGNPSGEVYDNSEQAAAEGLSRALYYDSCIFADNFDSGADLKGGPHVVRNSWFLRNRRGMRAWDNVRVYNSYIAYGGQGLETRFSDGDSAPGWTSGILRLTNCSLINQKDPFVMDSTSVSEVTYNTGTGSLPIEGEVITDQTNGDTAVVAGYADGSTGSTGTLYLHALRKFFTTGHVFTTASGFSATITSTGSTMMAGKIYTTNCLMANNKNFQSNDWNPAFVDQGPGEAVYSTTGDVIWIEDVSGVNPQLENAYDKYLDVKGIKWDRFYGPTYINELKPVTIAKNSFNSTLYAGSKGAHIVIEEEDRGEFRMGGFGVGQ